MTLKSLYYIKHILIMASFKGGAEITEVADNGEPGEEIPELPKTGTGTETGTGQRPAEDLYKLLLVVLCDIHKTEVRTMPPKMNTYVKKHLDFVAGHLSDMSLLNESAFDKEKFKKFVIDMCNKLYNFNENEKLQEEQTGGVRPERALSPRPQDSAPGSGYATSLVPSDNRTRRSRGSSHSRMGRQTSDLLNSWFVQCIILISLLGSIFCAYIAYVKFNNLVSTMTQTGTVFEITNFVEELGAGIGDGFAVYIWKTFTNDYNLVNNYYTSAYKDLLGRYLESSASTILEKANEVCVGADVFVEGNSMIQSGEIMKIVNKIVNAVTGVMTFKDTGNCISNTMKLLTLQEIDRMKTLLSLKFEEISMNHNQIWLYLQYAGFLAWPAILYYPRLFKRVGKNMMMNIRKTVELSEEINDQPESPPGDQRLLENGPRAEGEGSPSPQSSPQSPESREIGSQSRPSGGRKSKSRRLYRNRRVVTMRKKRKLRRSIRKN